MLSRSSKVRLSPASVTRDDRRMLAAGSDDFRFTSGLMSALRTRRRTLDLVSFAQGSAVPSASASTPAPQSLAFTRNGARHAPFTLASNWIGPVPDATTRSSPSRASRAVPSPDENLASAATSLRLSVSRSSPRIAATGGVADSIVRPLSCGASRSSVACAVARSAALPLPRSSASLARTGPASALSTPSRAASDGASGCTIATIRPSEAARCIDRQPAGRS